MSSDAANSYLSRSARVRLRRVAHRVVAVLVGGILGAGVWLVVVQKSRLLGLTDLDFVRGMATIFGSDGVDRRSVGSYGLYVTLAAGVSLVILHALVVPRLLRRSWWVQALPLAILTYLLWALAMAPSRPAGYFGLQAGGVSSAIAFLVGSAAFAIIAVRCYTLISGDYWWEEKDQDLSKGLDEISAAPAPSLELAEERPEEGRKHPRS